MTRKLNFRHLIPKRCSFKSSVLALLSITLSLPLHPPRLPTKHTHPKSPPTSPPRTPNPPPNIPAVVSSGCKSHFTYGCIKRTFISILQHPHNAISGIQCESYCLEFIIINDYKVNMHVLKLLSLLHYSN